MKIKCFPPGPFHPVRFYIPFVLLVSLLVFGCSTKDEVDPRDALVGTYTGEAETSAAVGEATVQVTKGSAAGKINITHTLPFVISAITYNNVTLSGNNFTTGAFTDSGSGLEVASGQGSFIGSNYAFQVSISDGVSSESISIVASK